MNLSDVQVDRLLQRFEIPVDPVVLAEIKRALQAAYKMGYDVGYADGSTPITDKEKPQ